jgi:hypothetical protein
LDNSDHQKSNTHLFFTQATLYETWISGNPYVNNQYTNNAYTQNKYVQNVAIGVGVGGLVIASAPLVVSGILYSVGFSSAGI